MVAKVKKIVNKLGIKGLVAVGVLGFCCSTVEYIPEKETVVKGDILKDKDIIKSNDLVASASNGEPKITKVSNTLRLSEKATERKLGKGKNKYRGISTGCAYVSTQKIAVAMLQGDREMKLGNYKLKPSQINVTVKRINNHPYMLHTIKPEYVVHKGKNKKYVKAIKFHVNTGDRLLTSDKQELASRSADKLVSSSKYKKLSTTKKHSEIKSYINKHMKLDYTYNKKVKKDKSLKVYSEYMDSNNVYALVRGKGTKTAKMRVYDLMAKKSGLTTKVEIKYDIKKRIYSTSLEKKVSGKWQKVKF